MAGLQAETMSAPTSISLRIITDTIRFANELSDYHRNCVITLVNNSRHDLTGVKYATTSGVIQGKVPSTIKSGEYGIVKSRKTNLSLRGAVGMISYEVGGMNIRRNVLRVAWHVPWEKGTLYDVYFNLEMGTMKASTREVEKMLYDAPPEERLRASEYAPGSFEMKGLKFEVAMLDTKQSIMMIVITDAKR